MADRHPLLNQEGVSPISTPAGSLEGAGPSPTTDRIPSQWEFPLSTLRIPSPQEYPPTIVAPTVPYANPYGVAPSSPSPDPPPKRKKRKWSPATLQVNPNIVLLLTPPDSPGYLSQGEPSPSQPFDSQYPWTMVISGESETTVILSRSSSPVAPEEDKGKGPRK